MSNFGIATEAPQPAEATEQRQRHLRSVEGVGIIAAGALLSNAYQKAEDLPDVAIQSNDQLMYAD